MKSLHGLGAALGDASRGVATETGEVASHCPATMVEVRDTSVVDAMDDAEGAGDGDFGNDSNGGS